MASMQLKTLFRPTFSFSSMDECWRLSRGFVGVREANTTHGEAQSGGVHCAGTGLLV